MFSSRKIPFLLLSLGCLLTAWLTLIPNAATAIWQIRWYPLQLCALFLLTAGGISWLLNGRGRKTVPAVPPAALSLLALGYLLSALTGPFPGRALIYSLPLFTAVFLGTVGMSVLSAEEGSRFLNHRRFQWTLAGFLLLWCGVSLFKFLSGDVIPFFRMVKSLDQAADGGLAPLLYQEGLPELRNSTPFGHPNYTSGFLLLLLPLLFHGIFRPADSTLRRFSVFVLLTGMVTLLSTQSRNALGGLIFAAAAGVWWLRLSAKKFMILAAGGVVLVGGMLLLVPRFQHFFLVSPGRSGIWEAARLTGLRYFPFGSGEGLAPEMIQLFTPHLQANWAGSMQFHQTWLHIWAVGGLISLLGFLTLTLWAAFRIVKPIELSPEFKSLAAPSVMAVSAGFVLCWADYQLDILPLALGLFFHLTVLAVLFSRKAEAATGRKRILPVLAAGVPLLGILAAAFLLPASLSSRQAIDRAGAAFENGNLSGAVSAYLEADALFPEPYSLNMAAVILSGVPESTSDAITLFEQSLERWEAQTLVHEFLVALYAREASENPDALEQALVHAERRAALAPQLKGVHLDLARLYHQAGYPEEKTVRALRNELLTQGDLLFAPVWETLGHLQHHRHDLLAALSAMQPEDPRLRRRVQLIQDLAAISGGGKSSVEDPELGMRMENRFRHSEELLLLNRFCLAEGDAARKAEMKRLLVYLFRRPVGDEMVAVFAAGTEEGTACMTRLLNFGQARFPRRMFSGVGISARHPLTIPVFRSGQYPDAFGSRFVQGLRHKEYPLEP